MSIDDSDARREGKGMKENGMDFLQTGNGIWVNVQKVSRVFM